MQQKEVINHRQMAWIIGSLITGGGLISLQNELIRLSHMDAWFSYILPVFYAFCIGSVFCYLSNRFPGKNLFEIVFALTGKWWGGLINLLFLVHMWLIMIRDVSGYCKYLNTILLPNTPEEVLVLVFVLMLIFYGRFNVEVAARANDIFFPIFCFIVFLSPLFLVNEMSVKNLEPVLIMPTKRILTGNLLSIGWYGELFIAGAFLHAVASSREMKAAIRHGTLLGTVMLTIFLLLEVVVLGTKLPGNVLYPSYTLVQQIHITDFLDRLDLVMLSIWFFIETIKIIFVYLAFLLCLGSYVGDKHAKLFNKPTALLLIIASILAFGSTTELFNFGNYGAIIIVAAYQPIVFALLVILGARKPRQGRDNGHGQAQDQAEDRGQHRMRAEDGRQGSPRRSGANSIRTYAFKYGMKAWNRSSNALLVACLAFICLGLAFGRRYSAFGLIGGFGYAACLFLCMLTTYIELIRTSGSNGR